MNTQMNNALRLMLVMFTGLLLVSCGGGGGSGGSATLQVAITDLPSAAYSSVTLSIRQIDVVAAGNDTPLNVLTLPASLQINVLNYNGHALMLGEGVIPAQSYHQVRLVLDRNPEVGEPLNYVTLNCSELPDEPSCDPNQIWPLKTPSGHTSGLKILLPGHMQLDAGSVQLLTLDFDPATAIVERGDWDPALHEAKERFLIKPTGIRTLASAGLTSYGILSGAVAYSDAPASGPLAAVTAFDADTLDPVAATLVDPLATPGDSFRFFLAAGDYNLEVMASGYQSATDGPFSLSETSTAPHPVTEVGTFILAPE